MVLEVEVVVESVPGSWFSAVLSPQITLVAADVIELIVSMVGYDAAACRLE